MQNITYLSCSLQPCKGKYICKKYTCHLEQNYIVYRLTKYHQIGTSRFESAHR